MRLIQNCVFESMFKRILRRIEDRFDTEAGEDGAPSMNGTTPTEWLAELWERFQRLHSGIYRLWELEDHDDGEEPDYEAINYQHELLETQIGDTIVTLLLILHELEG